MSASYFAVRSALLSSLFVLSSVAPAVDVDSSDAFAVEAVFEVVRPDGAGDTLLTLQPSAGPTLEFFFQSEEAVRVSSEMLVRGQAQDGLYRWRASFRPVLDEAALAALAASRQDPNPSVPTASIPARSGSVRIIDGGFLAPVIETDPIVEGGGDGDAGGTRDVITGDLVVYNSVCVGFDCPTTPSFGSDTIRLQENNLRIHFDDTSATSSFPANDWRLLANDTFDGGANFFGIEDSTLGRRLLHLEAGAPNNAIYLDSSGTVGFGTNLPSSAVTLHSVDGNTPGLRLDQSSAAGFAAQAWDIAGNETNFFIRDVTNGSRLPFRIRPGAPTSSLDIQSSGNVAMGRTTANAALHIQKDGAFTQPWLRINAVDGGTEETRMELDNAGNLFVAGAITQLSSRHAKTNLVNVAGSQLLQRLAGLSIWTWNYRHSDADDTHIGPVAEDFYQAFGFGRSETSISPADMAGVALAASQALQQEIDRRDRRIEQLEQRLARLEALLGDTETNAAER